MVLEKESVETVSYFAFSVPNTCKFNDVVFFHFAIEDFDIVLQT